MLMSIARYDSALKKPTSCCARNRHLPWPTICGEKYYYMGFNRTSERVSASIEQSNSPSRKMRCINWQRL
jgi:hypothetical protein